MSEDWPCPLCRQPYDSDERLTAALAALDEASEALVWYADKPAEHDSVDAWANWFKAEPGSRFRTVESARARIDALKGGET